MLELAAQVAFPLFTRQVFSLEFIPGSIRTSLTTFPRLGTPKHFPDFGAFTLQSGQGWALSLILEMGIWMLSAKASALGTAQLCR